VQDVFALSSISLHDLRTDPKQPWNSFKIASPKAAYALTAQTPADKQFWLDRLLQGASRAVRASGGTPSAVWEHKLVGGTLHSAAMYGQPIVLRQILNPTVEGGAAPEPPPPGGINKTDADGRSPLVSRHAS
jgi:hypothetical protein